MTPLLEPRGDGRVAVQGELNLASAPALLAASRRLFEQQPPRWIDLAEVSRSDSAGVALLVEWLRLARQHGQEIAFVNVPPPMRAIIQATGLDEVLPLA